MKIVTKKVGKDAEVIELIKLDYQDMRALVGNGNIEPIYFDEDEFIVWCNEEGKLINLDINIALMRNQKLFDTIHGDVFITNMEEGNEGLSDRQVQLLLERLNDGPCTVSRMTGDLVPLISI